MTERPYIGIDLFAGVGGLSYGLSEAGIDMQLGVDIDSVAAFNLKQNNRNMDIVVADIRNLDPIQLIKSKGYMIGDIDIIVGGPPCQGFSRSNHRTRNAGNPENDLYKEYFRFVRHIQPEVFLFENVDGLITLNKGQIFQDILKTGFNLGYHIYWKVINSEDFGVPQKRNRIFILGTKKKADISLSSKSENSIVSVREAIDDLPFIENGNSISELPYSKNSNLSPYQIKFRNKYNKKVRNNLVTKNGEIIIERYKHIPSGGNWKSIPSSLFKNYRNPQNCHGWIYYRLRWDQPSVVGTCSIH
jgi:DNA (cytosine-5)-methyltransferase 1